MFPEVVALFDSNFAAEPPAPRTYADDFFEKFPNAPRDGDEPKSCWAEIYGNGSCEERIDCPECWSRIMPGLSKEI